MRGDVIEKNTAQRKVPQVLVRGDLDAADLREIGLVGPAEEARQAAGPVLKLARPLEVFEPLVQRFVEADHHGRGPF